MVIVCVCLCMSKCVSWRETHAHLLLDFRGIFYHSLQMAETIELHRLFVVAIDYTSRYINHVSSCWIPRL